MTPEEAIEALKKQQDNGDTEEAHGYADDILCELLNSLGYEAVTAEFDKVHKWYA